MIRRRRHLDRLRELLAYQPVVAILGARQVGKTTLAETLASEWDGPTTRFDLEDSEHLARLADPKLALQDLRGLVILDEVQRLPEVFPTLRVLADRPESGTRFLVLGSASPELLQQSSESLAGRISYHELGGLALDEVGSEHATLRWVRGGFPRAFLASTDAESFEWRRSFVRTFLERDLPQLGVQIPATTLHRFWQMIAHWHGQLWNGAELARAFGVSVTSVRRYLDVLTAALVLRQLPPWFENIAKRQVRAPKVYVADSGILHALLGLRAREDVDGHPKLGASWEGFVIEELRARLGAEREECFFWATHAGAELDLMVIRGNRRLGFEVKRTTSPRVTASMRTALDDLRLDRLDVLHAGDESFPLGENIRAVAVRRLLDDVEPLG